MKSAGKDFFWGLGLPFAAAAQILKSPRLVVLSLVCAGVTAVCLLALLFGMWPLSLRAALALWGEAAGFRQWAATATAVIFYVLSVALGALTVPNVLLSPLQDPISEAAEAQIAGGTALQLPFSLGRMLRGMALSLRHTFARIFFMLSGMLVLLPLNLVPVVGSVLWAVCSSLWSMGWLAVEFVSGPAARHLLGFRVVLKALRARPALALGLGASLYVLLWVPVLNFFLVPVAVVEGTLAFHSLRTQGVFTLTRRE